MVHQSDPLGIARPCDVFRAKSGRMLPRAPPVYGHAGERGGSGDGVFRRGRPDLSEELANAIVFMASDEGSSGRSPLSGELSSESGCPIGWAIAPLCTDGGPGLARVVYLACWIDHQAKKEESCAASVGSVTGRSASERMHFQRSTTRRSRPVTSSCPPRPGCGLASR
jgi:hypothetical protein